MRNVKSESRSILSESCAVDLLVLIRRRGEIQALDLLAVNRNYVRMFDLARDLQEDGILKIHETKVPRLTYTIKLTSKGEKVADKLREAKNILGE
jgi:predicted transcriptional regulator